MNDHSAPATSLVPTQLTGRCRCRAWAPEDGRGAADHDQPYAGCRSYVFTTHQRLRLVLLRGEVLDSRLGQGRYRGDLDGAGEPVTHG